MKFFPMRNASKRHQPLKMNRRILALARTQFAATISFPRWDGKNGSGEAREAAWGGGLFSNGQSSLGVSGDGEAASACPTLQPHRSHANNLLVIVPYLLV
jgi:hypothetical protein